MKSKTKYPANHILQQRELIGNIIRNLREGRGYSQDELAEIMEVHRSTISKIETGKFAITIDYLLKFAWYLDFDIKLISKK